MFRLVLLVLSVCAALVQAVTTSNVTDLLLPQGQTNACYLEATLQGQTECSQVLFESYYGAKFTWTCPNFGVNLAASGCLGCPWDRLNPETVTPQLVRFINRSLIFHPAASSCLVADMMFRFNNLQTIHLYTRHHATIGIILPAFVNILTFYADNLGRPKTPSILGWTPSESLFIFAVMVSFYVGMAFSATARVFLVLCELPHDESAVRISQAANYAVMLIASVWRSLHLHVRTIDRRCRSWVTFVSSGAGSTRWARNISYAICCGLPVIIAACLLTRAFEVKVQVKSRANETHCQYGYRNASYGTIIYSTLLVQVVSIIIYSTGPPRRRYLFLLRCTSLCICLLVAVILFIMRFTTAFLTKSTSMLVDPIPDETFDFGVGSLGFI